MLETEDSLQVQTRERKVLTSLQGAWHNHGHRMHCMVRSSTMGSWAKPTAGGISQPSSVPLANFVGRNKMSKPFKVKRISCFVTFDPEPYLSSTRRCEGGDPRPPMRFLNETHMVTPICHWKINVADKNICRIKKRLVIGHTHCGKRGCAQTATNPTHQSAVSDLATRHGKFGEILSPVYKRDVEA